MNQNNQSSMQVGQESAELKLFFASKCFDTCVESLKDKFLNPYEKDCMAACLNNIRGFYIETKNGYLTGK